MLKRRLPLLALLIAGLLVLSLSGGDATAQQEEPQEVVTSQAAVGTSFTYQGRLNDGGSPATGSYDFRFRLYDAASGGSQVGSTVTRQDIDVQDGLFSVDLNFGDVLWGSARWIQIGVRPGASTGSFTTLSPLEQLKPTPYALGLPNVFVDQDTPFIGINRDYRIGREYFGVQAPVNSGYGGMYIETTGTSGKPFYGYATDGTLRAWHEYEGNTGKWHLNNDGRHLTVDDDGRMGLGTSNPVETLDVDGSIRSTADTVIEVSPFDMIESDGLSRLSFAAKYTGRMRVTNNNNSGERYVYVPVSVPSSLHGTQQKLKSLNFCYSLPVAGDVLQGRILEAGVRQIDQGFSGANLLFTDDVPVVAPERCFGVTASTPAEIEGSLWIRFALDMHSLATIEFGRMNLTLTSE